ncbi:MAG: flagellin [Pseudomonadales bacterium]
MPQIINTNIASLTAQRNLNSSQSANRTSLERLSSGLRINSAKDDAAGLAISTRFSSQIRGLSVAIRNAGDGISLAQTAEGALDSISSSLQRLRELALQSSNATNSDVDREALNAEAQQLISEITRTGEQTDFNGTNLLDGNFAASFQVGANAGETVSFGIAELTASNLGGGRTAGVSAIGSSNGLANGDLVINGAVIGPSVASDDTSSFANAPASAISKVAAINRATEQSGVQAEVLTNIAAGSVQNEASGGANATSGSITLNGVEIAIATGDVDEAADRSGIVSAINARSGETGVIAVDTGTRFGGVNLEAADGRNITLEFSSGDLSAASTGLTSQETTSGGYTLSATTSGTAIVISESTGDIANSGLVAGTYTANTAAVAPCSEDGAPFDTPAVQATVTVRAWVLWVITGALSSLRSAPRYFWKNQVRFLFQNHR